MDENMIYEMVEEMNQAYAVMGVDYTLEAKKDVYWQLHIHNKKSGVTTMPLIGRNDAKFIGKLSAMMLAINLVNGHQ